MKKIYFVLFPLILMIILLFSINLISIPSPSKLIIEEYNLQIK